MPQIIALLLFLAGGWPWVSLLRLWEATKAVASEKRAASPTAGGPAPPQVADQYHASAHNNM